MATDADETDGPPSAASMYQQFRRWYHIPILGAVMVYVFWTRFQNYDVFRRDGDGIWLQAVDSWYHWRTTEWMVENAPWVMGFDIWTGFPDGRTPGQFGTLFDQIVVAVAMVIGLGSPGEQDILLAALITVPALAAVLVIPVYAIGARLGNRLGGVVGVAVLALFSGEIFLRSTAGQFQHHIAEALFMAIAVFAIIVALSVAERDRPIWELVRQRDSESLREPTLYSALAGIAITLYIWTWPPGVVLIGILGIFFVVQLSIDYYRGRPPDHVAFVGVVSMLVVVAGTAIRIQEPGFGATGLDYFGPVFAALVAGGCLFMAGLARVWDDNDLSARSYPAAIAVTILATLFVLAVVLPGVFNTLVGNISGRIVPFGHSPGALTVAEATPPDDRLQFMYDEYKLAFFTGLAALPILAFRGVFAEERRSQYTFVCIWALVLISMGATQIRFNYYLAVAVAVLNAYLVAFLVAGIELPETLDRLPEYEITQVEAYQVFTVAIVLMLVFVPLLPPVASSTPMDVGGETGPSSDAIKWEGPNTWLQENTPAVGNYGGADNADELEYFGRYDRPAGGSFDYPEGAYGVLSWWDYGHLITVQGERIPHANPFQQNARSAAAFLTAQNESQAELYLDAIAAGETPTHESDVADLRDAIEDADDEPGIEYVMIDDEAATTKFPAITEWTGPDYLDYVDQEERLLREDDTQTVPVGGEYEETMLANLYLQDGTGLEHYRLVNESSDYTLTGFVGNAQVTLPIENLGNATDSSWQTVQEMELQSSVTLARAFGQGLPLGPDQSLVDPYIASQVKTFERVEGAVLEGSVPDDVLEGNTTTANLSLSASLPLETETERAFQYSQSVDVAEDGTFTIRVPHASDETLGPADGYANSSVLATDPGYEITLEDDTEDDPTVKMADNLTVEETAVQTGASVPVELVDPPESVLSDLDVAGQGANATIVEGDNESVAVDIENVGQVADEFELTLEIDEVSETETVWLEPGESDTVTFENATGAVGYGEHNVTVGTEDDEVTGTLTVESPADLSDLDILGQGAHATVLDGEQGDISLDVENRAVTNNTFNATLTVGDALEETASTADLDPGASETVLFENVTGDLEAGEHAVTVSVAGAEITGSITVGAPAALSDLDIAGQGANGTITAGAGENVSAVLTNAAAEPSSYEVDLDIGEDVTGTLTSSTLDTAGNETITFESVTEELEPDDYEVTVATDGMALTGSLTVEEAPDENDE